MDLTFVISLTTHERSEALDKRDELIDCLRAAGLRLTMTDCGLDIYMSEVTTDPGDSILRMPESMYPQRNGEV